MNLLLTGEQRELRAAVRSFLTTVNPRDGYAPSGYERLNGELGLGGLIVPEEYGGSGAGHRDLAVVLEETGAALLPGPFLATVFAAIVLGELGAKEQLAAIAAGTPATVGPLWGGGVTESGGALTGEALFVNGAEAELVLVRTPQGVFACRGTASPVETLDITRSQARIRFDGEPALALGELPARASDLIAVALAAEQLGVLRAALAAIVEYAKVRVAFGRQIGSYQGVKHKLADLHCALEQAESIVRYAAWTADEDPEELPKAAALAQAYVGRACFQAAKESLLLHGGIGFTWEHDAHLYYKRAKSDEVLLGPPRIHRAKLADLLEL
ncbi:acyl-CoA dehydrogenase [Acrocarpospora phusangensis]|uniref:Acyl-CoA dehydrogenase n=1 Tax=Acrocarpospora phusangensis TaxID=1070424 RepID=A0A919UQF2_9ACTN|nr:acyl-CoA dehydrogenase family protein [Acrocarpospora phusangensis]GIH26792.1 acyl-CoA dehydrogenase [Acrocarpospora phusangensis]